MQKSTQFKSALFLFEDLKIWKFENSKFKKIIFISSISQICVANYN